MTDLTESVIDGFLGRAERAEAERSALKAKLERVPAEHPDAVRLRDLLARIHRDGGNYTGRHGVEGSCVDAHDIVEGCKRCVSLFTSKIRGFKG